jgi:hypothetical protein
MSVDPVSREWLSSSNGFHFAWDTKADAVSTYPED